MILDPIDQNIRDQGFNFVPFDRYLDGPFQPNTLDMSGSGLASFGTPGPIPTGRFGLPVLVPGGDGTDGSTTTGPADTSGFDYEFDALGAIDNPDNVGLTEEEQEALDNVQNPGFTKGQIGMIGLQGFFNPFGAIINAFRTKKKNEAAAIEAAKEAAIQADFEREAAKGNKGADFTGGRYDGADTKSDYDADPTGFSGSSKDGGIIGYGGTSGTPRYQQFMDGGLADLVDIYD